MRISKTIREFVEEKIIEKYPMPVLNREAKETLDVALDETLEKLKMKYAALFLADVRKAGIPLDEAVSRCSLSVLFRDDKGYGVYKAIHNSVEDAFNEQTALVLKKRKDALTNILVSLELGGSKSELMEMLNNLPD